MCDSLLTRQLEVKEGTVNPFAEPLEELLPKKVFLHPEIVLFQLF